MSTSGVASDQVPTLLERDAALTTLEEALRGVTGNLRGRVVFVSGEAGAGKTALLRGFCARAPREADVYWATCEALFTPRPLGPLLDLADELGGDLPALVADGAAPHDVSSALLRQVDGRTPSIVVLEDVHWADEATFDVLRLLSGRAHNVPLLLVASYRSDQLDRTGPLRLLLGELPGRDHVSRVDVAALSRDAVAALAEPLGVDAGAIFSRTGGNAFFVTEILAAADAVIPDTVRDAVLARSARLSAAARSLLDAIAVVPGQTEVWLLEALETIADGAVDECLRTGMLTAEGAALAFRHELARLAVEESLSPQRRVELHRRAVGALDGRPEPARLAHHAEGAGDAEAVLRYAVAAAEQATAFGAHRQAAEQYARALHFAGGLAPAARASLLKRFADACYLTDMSREGIDALAEAAAIHRAAGDDRAAAAALLARAKPLACAGRRTEANADVEAACALLAEVGSDADLAEAYGSQSANALFDDRLDDAIAWGTRAVAIAERIGDRAALVYALNNIGASQLVRGDDEGLVLLERSLAISRESDLHPSVARAYHNIVASFSTHQRWDRAAPYIRDGVAYCRDHGLEAWENALLGAQTEAELGAGRFDAAAELASDLLTRLPPEHRSSRQLPLMVLALARARRGDPDAVPLLDEALDVALADGTPQAVQQIALPRAEVAWLQGQPERVEGETALALALTRDRGEIATIVPLLAWRRRAGLTDELPPQLGDSPWALELAGDHRAAADAWSARGLPYEAALALVDAPDEQALREAHEQLLALEARGAAAVLARRLRAQGARNVRRGPIASTKSNVAGLTARQLQVLALIDEGLRNAEIAERLVLSEKTVDHHVSSILGKLGVSSRGQASAVGRRLGLLDQAGDR